MKISPGTDISLTTYLLTCSNGIVSLSVSTRFTCLIFIPSSFLLLSCILYLLSTCPDPLCERASTLYQILSEEIRYDVVRLKTKSRTRNKSSISTRIQLILNHPQLVAKKHRIWATLILDRAGIGTTSPALRTEVQCPGQLEKRP